MDACANRVEPLARRSGIQLHITSLPSGRLGADAYRFVDWLVAAGQSYWQVLPLNPPDRHGSPYRSSSAFACWPRLLERPQAPVSAAEEGDLREREGYWIGDWERVGGRRAVRDQVRFEREWSALRSYAAQTGVAIIGDLPLYVAPGSVDHVSHPRLFDDTLLAGAPPDSFNAAGQLWGNPVYDWPALARTGYRWWIERLRRAGALYDLVRLDHFRGFVAYWAVPAGARSARHGHWRRGPGAAPLLHARRELGGLPLIAEDLGAITPPVERLRERLGIPGMAVLQFVYGAAAEDPLEEAARERVLYTATHDQTTLMGWWDALDQAGRAPVLNALRARGIAFAAGPWPLLRLAHGSSAALVIAQMQDILGLPARARTNTPGTATGNWQWRMAPGAATPALARRLRGVTEAAGRLA
jgi:4-alpha-glucanotransferase